MDVGGRNGSEKGGGRKRPGVGSGSNGGGRRRFDTNIGSLFLYDGAVSVSRSWGGNSNAVATEPAPPPDSEGEP